MNGLQKKQNKKTWICMFAAVLTAGILTGIFVQRSAYRVEAKLEETQRRLADEVLRFHVLANSDSEKDQALKMKVKGEIIQYMKEELPDAGSVEETKAWAKSHEKELQEVARETVLAEGYDYPVTAEVTTSYFPDKTYGDVTFPAGEYEALRIEIGATRGITGGVCYTQICVLLMRSTQ